MQFPRPHRTCRPRRIRPQPALMILALCAVLLASCGAPAATQAPASDAAAQPSTAGSTAAGTTASGSSAAQAIVASDADPRDGQIKAEAIPDGLFPLTPQKATLRIAVPSNPAVEDFNTNAFTKWYEEQTNVAVEWVVLPAGDEGLQKLNLMLSSGDIPDVIMGFYDITPALLQLYGQQGIFLPLNDLIEQHGTNVKNAFAQYPLAREAITAPDGQIYGLPEINDCYHCSVAQKLWIYKPWLDKLGLEVPTTTDEFYQVLKAFKEQDPNGNGQADEVPLSAATDGWNTFYDYALMNAFLLNPGTRQVVKDGKIQVTYNQPEWREGLRYLNRLHNEGLLDPNGLTQDTVALQRLGQSDPVTLGAAPGGFPGIWVPVVEEEGARLSQYVVVTPLTGPNGFRVQPSNPYSAFTPGRFIITSAAKDPALAFRWGDAFFQQEVELNAYYGLKDVGWRWANEGEKGINGEPALNAQLKTWGNTQNDHWSQTNVSFRSSDWRLGLASDNPYALETFLYNESRKLEEYKQAPETAVPPLYFGEADAQEVAEIGSTLDSYVEEMMARFITGDANLDTEWETYLETLEQQGLTRYLELLQTAYDAKPSS